MEVRHTLGERYFALDAMRGIAALLVVLYHCAEILPALKIQGHLAVDFFFALSGFVIARAYQDRLAAGLPFQRFALARVIRLYPLFLAGTLIGASRHVMGAVLNLPEAIPMGTLLPILLLNAFMLPGPSPNEYIFPFDGPTWSLFFELIVNLAFGLFLFRWSAGRLWVLVAVSGVVLGALTIQAGHSNLGWSWPTIPGGFARVFFSFTLGMLFSRILANTPKRVSWWGLVPMLLLIALMLVDVDPRNQAAFDLFSVLIGAPLLLLGGIALDVPAKLRRACGWLGDISYPVYTLHIPFFSLCTFAVDRFGLHPVPVVLVFVAFMLVFADLMGRFYDAPVRSWLSNRLPIRHPPRLQTT